MKKYIFVVGFLGLGLILSGCSYFGRSSTPVEMNQVSIVDFRFEPRNIIVQAGTEVTFTNNSQSLHDVTFDSFKSGTLQNGESFKRTFNDVGTFDYLCSIHPSMTGSVEVR